MSSLQKEQDPRHCGEPRSTTTIKMAPSSYTMPLKCKMLQCFHAIVALAGWGKTTFQCMQRGWEEKASALPSTHFGRESIYQDCGQISAAEYCPAGACSFSTALPYGQCQPAAVSAMWHFHNSHLKTASMRISSVPEEA